jgi:DNA-binding response OmpR family regulator
MSIDYRLKYLEMQEKLADLQEVNRQMIDGFAPVSTFPLSWKLTPIQSRYLSMLAKRELATHENFAAIHTGFDGHAPDLNLVKVHIKRIRKKLEGVPVNIMTIHGVGYALDLASRGYLRAFVRDHP